MYRLRYIVSFAVSFYGSVSNYVCIASCCNATEKLESIGKEAIIVYSKNHPDILKDELKRTKKTSFFLVFTQPIVVIPRRPFGTTYRSHLQGVFLKWDRQVVPKRRSAITN